MMEIWDWVKKWEAFYGVAPRLSAFFKGPEAIKLVQAFRKARADPEVLPFLLIFFVWPEQERKKRPSSEQLDDVVKQLNETARTIENLADRGLLPPQEVAHVRTRLRSWSQSLTTGGIPVGNLTIGERCQGSSRRKRIMRRIVFFLTGYFELKRICARPPWKLITDFLILTGAIDKTTSPKTVGTEWSTLLNRELRPDEPLEPRQESFIQLFESEKRRVWYGEDRGQIFWRLVGAE